MSSSDEELSLSLLLPSSKVIALRSALLDWFEINGRHWIPWKLKADGTKPDSGEMLCVYKIWIAEVMLQQTQLKVVLPYWESWMSVFPTLPDLANANEKEVLMRWQGLGYYSRAHRLHKVANIFMNLIGSKRSLNSCFWPRDIETWLALPGIGRTTAGSILSSAFDLPQPLLDGNVKRLLARLFASSKPPKRDLFRLWLISEQLLSPLKPRKFNQALMDLGAMVCTPFNPRCDICPWQEYCSAYALGKQKEFPVKEPAKPLPFEVIGIGVVLNHHHQILIDQRLEQGLLGGMWEFPGGKKEVDESIEQTIARELKEELSIEVEVGEKLIDFEHAYSHKKLRFIVHICKWLRGKPQPLASQKVEWVSPESLENYPFPAANTKIISSLKKYLNTDKLTKDP